MSYHPVCSRDGRSVFFSPCHAGCRLANSTADSSGGGRDRRNLYWDCACVRERSRQEGFPGAARPWWTKPGTEEEEEDAGRPVLVRVEVI